MPIKELHFPKPEDVFSPVFFKLWDCKTRFVINYGGTGSSKSYSAAQKEVMLAAAIPNITTAVFRKVGTTLKKSVYKSFKSRIREFDLWDIFDENKTEMTLTCTQTKSQIWFLGLDDPEKLKSIEGVNRIMIEEASELELDDLLELNRRVRGVPDIQITLNFNPIHEEHWLKKHFFDSPLPNATIIHSTYHENKWMSKEDREEIERLRDFDENQYNIYALGHWGITGNDNPWLFAFDYNKHVEQTLPFYPSYPVYLSFDFNREPLTCVAVQMSPEQGLSHSFVHFIKEFSEDIQLRELCFRVKAFFPGSLLFVTGDATGAKGDIGFDKRNESYYTMIKNYLGLTDKMMHLNTSNLHHNDSRNLCNLMFYQYPKIKLSKEGCPKLIADCQKAELDIEFGQGRILKDREKYKLDLFDGMRYIFQTYFLSFVNKVYIKPIKRE